MESILVATDFSINSKAAIRFAIQLERQGNFKPTYLHVTEILKPTKWSTKFFEDFEQKELEQLHSKLKSFVRTIYKKTGHEAQEYNILIKNTSSIKKSILHNAEKGQFDYICIGSKGGGNSIRLFGSISSALMSESVTPIIAVPVNYRMKEINNICYASDLSKIDDELQKVMKFTKPLKTRVELLHFKVPIDFSESQIKADALAEKLAKHDMTSRLEHYNFEHTLVENINAVVKKAKPNMLIMFTEQKRTFFERLFLSSKSSEFAHTSKIPVLVYRK